MTLLALTGTPGTGKTTVARELTRRGVPVLDAATLADEVGAAGAADERGSRVVDLDELDDGLASVAPQWLDHHPLVVIEGHYAHDLEVDAVVVLRCAPMTLLARLEARGWPPAKVRENVEAEALGVIAWEALDGGHPAWEVDTTTLPPTTAAGEVQRRPRNAPPPEPGRWDLLDLPFL